MKYILDRIEKKNDGSKVYVFECGDEYIDIEEKNIPKDDALKMKIGIILEAKYESGKLSDIHFLNDETEKKTNEMKGRLSSLFNRNKK